MLICLSYTVFMSVYFETVATTMMEIFPLVSMEVGLDEVLGGTEVKQCTAVNSEEVLLFRKFNAICETEMKVSHSDRKSQSTSV